MTDPSESWLDWHFGTQMVAYTEQDLPAACPSDRVIMARWIKVFEKAPPNQKLARNSLMLLMHAHVEDFGFLRPPFTDAMNCNRDLNQVLNGYRGLSLLKSLRNARTKMTDHENKAPQRLTAGRTPTGRSRILSSRRISSRTKLAPITEVSEHSSVYSSEVTVITRRKLTREYSGDCSHSPRPLLASSAMSVREKVKAIEKKLSIKKVPMRVRSSQNVRKNAHQNYNNNEEVLSSSNQDVIPPPQEPPSQKWNPKSGSFRAARKQPLPMRARSTVNVRKYTLQTTSSDAETSSSIHEVIRPSRVPRSYEWEPRIGCSSAVRNLQSCFQEISERLKSSSEYDNPVLGKIRAMAPPPAPPKRSVSEEDLVSKPRLSGGKSIPQSYERDKTLMDLLRCQEEVRQQCLQYYNLDGTLKDDSELPAPTSVPEKKIKGFAVGAGRAMERLKRWRGKPNELKFFRTLFRGCGLERDVTGTVKALDRRLEQVALQWLRSKRRRCPDQKPAQNSEELLDKRNQLEAQKAYKKEYMAHLAEIRKLCDTHCRGAIRPDVLEKMLRCLDKQYEAVSGDVEGLGQQLEEMFSGTWSSV